MKFLEKCQVDGRRILKGIGLMRGEKGFSLIESLIAIAVLSIIGSVFLCGLSTASKVRFLIDERETAKNLAESQMEYVKGQAYLTSYAAAPISGEYTGYSVTIYADDVTLRDDKIQKIRVIVSHQNRPIILAANSTLEDYKVK